MLEHNFAISQLQRKLANIIRVGVVKEVDYSQARVVVKVDEILTGWLPWITFRAGEERSYQVLMNKFSPSGELSLGR